MLLISSYSSWNLQIYLNHSKETASAAMTKFDKKWIFTETTISLETIKANPFVIDHILRSPMVYRVDL